LSSIAPGSAASLAAASQVSSRRKLGAVAAALAYLAFVHIALARGWTRAALAALVLIVFAGLFARARTQVRKLAAVTAGIAILAGLAAVPKAASLEWVMFLPPILINGVLCYGFGRTLLHGRVPMATEFARHARGGDLPADLVVYTRQITLAWTVLFAAMLTVATALAAFGSLAAWSWFANIANPLLVGAFFLSEYAWRLHRFRHHRHTSLLDMLQYLRMPAVAKTETAPMLPMLRLHHGNDPVAWRHGSAITASQLVNTAAALATQLPQRRHVLNLCRDRYHFVVGFAAAMMGGRVTLLPSSHGEAAIRDLCRAYPDLCCITDHSEVPAGIPVMTLPLASAIDADAPLAQSFPGDQHAAIIFTSGSTGTPTPHLKTWGSLVRGALTLGTQLGMAAPVVTAPAQPPHASQTRELPVSPSIVGTVPPQHMFGLETTVMLPLQWRGAFNTGRPLLPTDIKSAIETLPEPRWLMTTPLHLDACVKDGLDLQGTLSGVISSTMPLAQKLATSAETLFGCAISEIYGSTETGMIAMRRTASGPAWTLCDGLSMKVEAQETRIEGGHVVPPFVISDRIEPVGERTFILLGRAGDLIKVAGKRSSLEALNERLRAVPGVLDGVFYIPPSLAGSAGRPLAFAVAPDTTADAIMAALRADLDPVFLPRPLYLVPALPRSNNGKITEAGLALLLREIRKEDGLGGPEAARPVA
jgi:uncharacterized membrane protein/acyl-CoA synthetase (AMP-forming)/AMP-acid ligase II